MIAKLKDDRQNNRAKSHLPVDWMSGGHVMKRARRRRGRQPI